MNTGKPKFAAIGECMIELRHRADGALDMSFGGDSANTAIYTARLLGDVASVDYISALGDDPYSDQIAAFLGSEGVGTSLLRRLSGRMPGLYLIRTDDRGERSFHYYRSQAAARDMFQGDDGIDLLGKLPSFDWIYLTGISLSVISDGDQTSRLVAALKTARERGARVVFDGNYRPAGWSDIGSARAAFTGILGHVDMALVTFDDETVLFGDTDAVVCADRLHNLGVAEVVVKLGRHGCRVSGPGLGEYVATEANDRPVDTTAAGDAFNGAYLACRIAGGAPLAAAKIGNVLAGEVIRHRGAVIDRNVMPTIDTR